MSTQPPYKEYQYLYRELVEEHDDAIDKVPSVVTENTLEEKLRGAMAYFEAQSFPIIYPGKSYGVAVVYAYHILRDYNIPVLETLNESDLFLGEDPYFVVYQDDPETYDRLLEKLQPLGDITELGWAKQTSEYYRLECTAEGLAEVMARG
jgi:hypothetical protein